MIVTRGQLSAATADELVTGALDRLYAVDRDLPPRIHERTVAGLFREHLRDLFTERGYGTAWRVDTEYDRLGEHGDPKVLGRLSSMLAAVARSLGWPVTTLVGTATGRVVPDVVIHRRGSGRGAGNLVVCELKRSNADARDIAVDLVKLAGYIDDIGYEHAYLILLGDMRETCLVHRATADIADIVNVVRRLDERARIRRWRRGHQMAEQRQRHLQAVEGPRPERAVAESLSALNALDEMGQWPGPRDPVSEQAVERVRRRWALVQRRAKQSRTR
jgi:hypothetical protein